MASWRDPGSSGRGFTSSAPCHSSGWRLVSLLACSLCSPLWTAFTRRTIWSPHSPDATSITAQRHTVWSHAAVLHHAAVSITSSRGCCRHKSSHCLPVLMQHIIAFAGTWLEATPQIALRPAGGSGDPLTKVCRVVVGGAVESQFPQVGNQVGDPATVDTLTLAQHVQLETQEHSSDVNSLCH